MSRIPGSPVYETLDARSTTLLLSFLPILILLKVNSTSLTHYHLSYAHHFECNDLFIT